MSAAAFESPERADFSDHGQSFLYGEHVSRYQFAAHFVRGKRVVDAASGTGYGSALMRQAGAVSVVGIDLDAGSIATSQRLLAPQGIEFHAGDCGTYDLAQHAPEVIVSFETIEHIPDPRAFLDRVRDALPPDGLFLVTCPNNEPPGANPYHLHSWDADGFRGLLADYFDEIIMLGQVPTSSYTMNREFIGYLDQLVGVMWSHPSTRLWRAFRKLLGKPEAPRPEFGAFWTAPHDWWFTPETGPQASALLAICRRPIR